MGLLDKQMLRSHSTIDTGSNRASELREPDNEGKVSNDEILQAFGLPLPWALPRHTESHRSQACRSLETLPGPGEIRASPHSDFARRSFEREPIDNDEERTLGTKHRPSAAIARDMHEARRKGGRVA
jgi:hypothetical protein